MLNSIKRAARNFLDLPAKQNRPGGGTLSWFECILDAISKEGAAVRSAIRDVQAAPALACVSVLCDTVGPCGEKETTTLGAEGFVSLGGGTTIVIESQRLTGRWTFFVSGHPNLVITAFNIGNDCRMSNFAGTKFGVVHGTCKVGQHLKVRVEYRIEGQSL